MAGISVPLPLARHKAQPEQSLCRRQILSGMDMGNTWWPRATLEQGGPANVVFRPPANLKLPTKTEATPLLKWQQSWWYFRSTWEAEAGGPLQTGGQLKASQGLIVC